MSKGSKRASQGRNQEFSKLTVIQSIGPHEEKETPRQKTDSTDALSPYKPSKNTAAKFMKNQGYRPSLLKYESKRSSLQPGLADNLGEPTGNLTKNSQKLIQTNTNKRLKKTTLSNQRPNQFTENDEMSLPQVDLHGLLVEVHPASRH